MNVKRVPIHIEAVKELLLEILKNRGVCGRAELLEGIKTKYKKFGGVIAEGQDVTSQFKRASRQLETEGLIRKTGAKGIWKYVGEVEEGEVEEGEVEEGEVGDIVIGDGKECVYVYYYKSEKELAELKGGKKFPCKIGMSKSKDYRSRIGGQGANTARSEKPAVGLVIYTDKARSLESVIHEALEQNGDKVGSSGTGNEWFNTTPEHIRNWYEIYQKSLSLLS